MTAGAGGGGGGGSAPPPPPQEIMRGLNPLIWPPSCYTYCLTFCLFLLQVSKLKFPSPPTGEYDNDCELSMELKISSACNWLIVIDILKSSGIIVGCYQA